MKDGLKLDSFEVDLIVRALEPLQEYGIPSGDATCVECGGDCGVSTSHLTYTEQLRVKEILVKIEDMRRRTETL